MQSKENLSPWADDKTINFRVMRLETVLPLIAGVYCSLFMCALVGSLWGVFKPPVAPPPPQVEVVVAEPHEEDEGNFLLASTIEFPDPVLEYYRNPEYNQWVIDFFSGLCSNREVAQAVLLNADIFEVPPALVFALCWEESRFNPNAINRFNRDGSIDRGLFQLNNRSFPNLDSTAIFDIETNVYHGIAHFRYCLDAGGSEISALAMYNAGTGRVRTSGAPEVTLNYISRILENRGRIESRFHARLIKEEEYRLTQIVPEEAEEPPPSRPIYSRPLIIPSISPQLLIAVHFFSLR